MTAQRRMAGIVLMAAACRSPVILDDDGATNTPGETDTAADTAPAEELLQPPDHTESGFLDIVHIRFGSVWTADQRGAAWGGGRIHRIATHGNPTRSARSI